MHPSKRTFPTEQPPRISRNRDDPLHLRREAPHWGRYRAKQGVLPETAREPAQEK